MYFAGDTDLFPEMARLAPVDVALLPVAGWGPKLGPGHLDAARAAQAAALLRARIAIPIHWGTLHPRLYAARRLVQPTRGEFAAQVAAVAPEVEVRVLRPAESTSVARVGLVPEAREPAPEDPVHPLGADHRLVGPVELGREQDEREALAAAHSAVGADELLEGGDLVRLLPVRAVHEHVGAVLEGIRPADMVRGVGP